MNKVRWGILSTSLFARTKVIPALRKCEHVELVAIASRDLAKARAVAAELGIPKAHGSYDALLSDPDVDVVYNPAPNHLHVPWSIRALEGGKHVLCEKPIGMNAGEAGELLDAARRHPKQKVMEAFMYRLHPQWQRARQIVRSGGVGEARVVESFFSYFNDDPANIRNDQEIGGGGLMDIGCYNISYARWIFDAEPTRVVALIDNDPTFKTDRMTSGLLDFSGRTSTFTCSMQLQAHQRVNVIGTEGRVEIEIPCNAPADKPCRIWHDRAGAIEEISFPTCDQYTLEADAFALAVLNDTPVPTPLEDAVANMRVIDALVESARTGRWVDLPRS
jgi:predicted dehydrogenase